MTRAEFVTQARKWAEGEDSDRWDDDEILLYADLVFRREWAEILKVNPDYRTATRTASPSSDGVFAVSSLNSGSGDSLERFHRVRYMKVGDTPLEQLDVHERPTDNSLSAAYGWFRDGNNIQVLPPGTATVTAKVTHTPPRPSELSGDGIELTFVDTYEQILALETAALMLSKGGTETDAAKELRSVAAELRGDMLSEISNTGSRPAGFAHDDSAEAWGGQ